MMRQTAPVYILTGYTYIINRISQSKRVRISMSQSQRWLMLNRADLIFILGLFELPNESPRLTTFILPTKPRIPYLR